MKNILGDVKDSGLGILRDIVSDNIPMNVKELEDRYQIEAELPGFKKEEISASLVNDVLEIAATKDEIKNKSDENMIINERSTVTKKRKIILKNVLDAKIKAKFEDGILSLEVMKDLKKVERTKIEIE